ncbi:MAG TPA: HAMP domain-containing protein, partial [Streptosporangiaceae bacterium]
MTSPAQQTGFWHSVRELPGRTPLRVKLIAALLALVAIGLVVISVVGIAILRNDLIGPYDNALQEQFQGPGVSRLIQAYLNNGTTATAQGTSLDWIPAGGRVQQVIQPTSGLVGRLGMPAAPLPSPVISASPSSIRANLGHPFTVPAESGSGRWRVLMEQLPLSNGSTGTVVLAADVTSAYTTVGQLAAVDLIVSVVLLLGLAVVGVTVVRRSLRPLHEIEQTAGAIAAGDLTRRVPERDPGSEVGRLGRSLNVMLSQIETAFRSQARSEEAARR